MPPHARANKDNEPTRVTKRTRMDPPLMPASSVEDGIEDDSLTASDTEPCGVQHPSKTVGLTTTTTSEDDWVAVPDIVPTVPAIPTPSSATVPDTPITAIYNDTAVSILRTATSDTVPQQSVIATDSSVSASATNTAVEPPFTTALVTGSTTTPTAPASAINLSTSSRPPTGFNMHRDTAAVLGGFPATAVAGVFMDRSILASPVVVQNPGYLPDDTMIWMQRFVSFQDPATRRYSIGCVPPGLTWGVPTPTNEDLDRLLCSDGVPVTFWLAGIARSLWFFENSGDPRSRVNIGVRLLRDGDLDIAHRLVNGRSRPPVDEMPTVIYAGKWMASRSKGDPTPTAGAFTRVYDATNHFGPKATMDLISTATISKNDIVLLECQLTRWKTGDRAKNGTKWVTWRCGFELSSVSLLYIAPDTSTDAYIDVDVETAFI